MTRKAIEECKKTGSIELELIDKGISSLEKYEQFGQLSHIYKLSLAHNKIQKLPASIRGLSSLELLNLCDNHLLDLGEDVSLLKELRILILGMNCLTRIPSSLISLPHLQVLDLSYNFLNNDSLLENFGRLENLRALYLADNDLTQLPMQIVRLEKLEILNVRGNDLTSLPAEIGHLPRLREFNAQGNRLTLLPPQFGELNFSGPAASLQLEFNPWMPQLEKRMKQDSLHVFFEYLRSADYKRSYERFLAQLPTIPAQRRIDKASKKKLAEYLPASSKQTK